MLLALRKYPVCVFSISPQLSTPFHRNNSSFLLVRDSWLFLNWFKSYLSSRSFRVKCDNHMSSPHTCSCGVPQGSVLGPLLFFMYSIPLSTLFLIVVFESSLLCRRHSTFLSIPLSSTLTSLSFVMLYNIFLLG